jgi:hypothetical protein
MQRRELLRLLGAAASLSVLPPGADPFLVGRAVHARTPRGGPATLDSAQAALVTRLADRIIPRTDTPGASDVDVTGFIDHLLTAWYPAADRDQFLAGLAAIEARATAAGGVRFVELTEPDQLRLLTALDGATGPDGSAEWAMARIKSLTVFGYFTSERVVKEVIRTPIMPRRFEGCVHV